MACRAAEPYRLQSARKRIMGKMFRTGRGLLVRAVQGKDLGCFGALVLAVYLSVGSTGLSPANPHHGPLPAHPRAQGSASVTAFGDLNGVAPSTLHYVEHSALHREQQRWVF